LLEISRGGVSAQIAGALLQAGATSLDLSQAKDLGAAEMRVTYQAPNSLSEDASPPQTPAAETKAEPPERDAPTTTSRDTDKDAGLEDSLEKDTERVEKLR